MQFSIHFGLCFRFLRISWSKRSCNAKELGWIARSSVHRCERGGVGRARGALCRGPSTSVVRASRPVCGQCCRYVVCHVLVLCVMCVLMSGKGANIKCVFGARAIPPRALISKNITIIKEFKIIVNFKLPIFFDRSKPRKNKFLVLSHRKMFLNTIELVSGYSITWVLFDWSFGFEICICWCTIKLSLSV